MFQRTWGIGVTVALLSLSSSSKAEEASAAAPSSVPSAVPMPVVPSAPIDDSPSQANAEEFLRLDLVKLLTLDWRITTASRVAERATDAPATVYVISKQDIRLRNYSTLADVLKDLPGMETVEQYYSEQGTLVPVRGVVGNNKVVLLINGMRVNPPGGEELMIRNDVSVRFADQIEVIYGPGSTLYGQDAISAVINIKTKQVGGTGAEILGGYGFHQTREGFASFGTTLREDSDSPVAVSGFVSYKASDLANFRKEYPDWWGNYQKIMPGLGRDPNVDPVRGDLGYSAFARIETRHASVQAWFRESERSTAEGSGEGGSHPVLFFTDEAKWRDRSLVVEAQHALELAQNLTLHSIFTFNRYEVDPRSRYVFPVPPTLYLNDFKYGLGASQTIEEKLDWQIASRTRAVFGVVAGNYDVIPKASVLGGADPSGDIVAQAGILTYFTRPNDPTSAVSLFRAENLHYRQFGAYAEGSHRFSDKLRAILGIRVDGSTRYSQVPISPRAAIIYNGPDKRLTLKYVFSMAYVAPAPYFGHNIYDNGVQIGSGNTNLQPERAVSNEINVTWQARDLLATASAYYNRQSNLLITNQSEAPETVIVSPVFANPDGTGERRLTHSVNLGASNVFGFDLSARYDVEPVSGWASYSYVDFSRMLNGRSSGLDQISRHNVRFGITWSVIPNLSITPSLVLRSTPENLPDTYVGTGVSLKTPYEVNLSVLYTPFENVDVFATARNLTNHHYALRGVAGPALQEPLTVMGGLRLKI